MVVGVSRVGKDRFGAPPWAAFTPLAGGQPAAEDGRSASGEARAGRRALACSESGRAAASPPCVPVTWESRSGRADVASPAAWLISRGRTRCPQQHMKCDAPLSGGAARSSDRASRGAATMSRDVHRPVTIRRPVPSRENYGRSQPCCPRPARPVGVQVVLCQAPHGTRQIGGDR